LRQEAGEMHPVLRLYEDVLSTLETIEFRLPPLPRFIFVVQGGAIIGGKRVGAGEAWQGERETLVRPGPEGVTCWRWELSRGDAGSTVAAAPGMMTHEKLTAFLETMPKDKLLMRGDNVAFPPGGCAYRHTHQGPGIRCLIEGGIRIDTHHRSTSYGPGGAWYESGPDPVFAQAAKNRSSRFIRVLILPRALIGKSSISYVNEADKAKPKTQQYKVYADAPIDF
jgi:hypothetical protein